MNTDHFKEKLVLFIDGDLGRDERLEVETHLKKCKACARELESLKRTLSLTRMDEAPDFKLKEWVTPSGKIFPFPGLVRRSNNWTRWVWIPLTATLAIFFAVIMGGDALKRIQESYTEGIVVVGSDSLSESEGQELAVLLLNEDENLKEDLLSYEEQSPRNIYTYVGELEEDEEEALVSLIKEQFKDQEGVSL